ncbi:hypothetical protein DFP72DRAFT_1081850 [Ephemerocybe angulata]|uniref:Uncharacterized protein n=1 Tax=Ephemerocybe angulata TaxID=980116 RepID=A0A8H6LSW0_9AGAR|nr:hypothetical protein DFP72DRAFT_1081850 [Tulosesus angulatus]
MGALTLELTCALSGHSDSERLNFASLSGSHHPPCRRRALRFAVHRPPQKPSEPRPRTIAKVPFPYSLRGLERAKYTLRNLKPKKTKKITQSVQTEEPAAIQTPQGDASVLWSQLGRYLDGQKRPAVVEDEMYNFMRNLDYDTGIDASMFLDLFWICTRCEKILTVRWKEDHDWQCAEGSLC